MHTFAAGVVAAVIMMAEPQVGEGEELDQRRVAGRDVALGQTRLARQPLQLGDRLRSATRPEQLLGQPEGIRERPTYAPEQERRPQRLRPLAVEEGIGGRVRHRACSDRAQGIRHAPDAIGGLARHRRALRPGRERALGTPPLGARARQHAAQRRCQDRARRPAPAQRSTSVAHSPPTCGSLRRRRRSRRAVA